MRTAWTRLVIRVVEQRSLRRMQLGLEGGDGLLDEGPGSLRGTGGLQVPRGLGTLERTGPCDGGEAARDEVTSRAV